MNFKADQVGRYMLYFVVNSQPSNVVIVDVFAQAPSAQYITPSGYGQINNPSTQYQTYSATIMTPIASMPTQTPTVNGDTPGKFASPKNNKYNGVFISIKAILAEA